MENQNEIIEVVEESNSKKGLKKLILVATGIAAGIGTVFFIRKRKAKQLDEEEIEVSEDLNESEEK